jgi:hypothetical protein
MDLAEQLNALNTSEEFATLVPQAVLPQGRGQALVRLETVAVTEKKTKKAKEAE